MKILLADNKPKIKANIRIKSKYQSRDLSPEKNSELKHEQYIPVSRNQFNKTFKKNVLNVREAYLSKYWSVLLEINDPFSSKYKISSEIDCNCRR